MWRGRAPAPEREPGLELPHPPSLEAPKGEGACLRSHTELGGDPGLDLTVGPKGT